MINIRPVKNFFRKATRFGLLLPLTSLFLTYISGYIPNWLSKRIAYWKQKAIRNYLHKTIGNLNISINDNCDKKNQEPTCIWYCWLQGEDNLPEIPRMCLDALRKNSSSHPVVFITLDNYKNYVTLNPRVEKLFYENKISFAHFSDILRMNLLNQNGGLWMDSTMLLTRPIDSAIFEKPFYTIKIKEFGNFVSKCRWSTFCIGGYKKNSLFDAVCKSFDKYLEQNDIFIDYFMFDSIIDFLYDKYDNIKKIIDDNEYNNLNVHYLSKILCSEYSAEVYNEITEDTYMFKLSWKSYDSSQLNKEGTYYQYLRNLIYS